MNQDKKNLAHAAWEREAERWKIFQRGIFFTVEEFSTSSAPLEALPSETTIHRFSSREMAEFFKRDKIITAIIEALA